MHPTKLGLAFSLGLALTAAPSHAFFGQVDEAAGEQTQVTPPADPAQLEAGAEGVQLEAMGAEAARPSLGAVGLLAFPEAERNALVTAEGTVDALPPEVAAASAAPAEGSFLARAQAFVAATPRGIGTAREALQILTRAGFIEGNIHWFHRTASNRRGKRLHPRGWVASRSKLESGLRALWWGYTYKHPTSTPSLRSARVWQYLRHVQVNYEKARRLYGRHPTISYRASRRVFDEMLSSAAGRLTQVPGRNRQLLMKALMTIESGKVHWRNFRPVVSYAGAVGLCQVMPRTSQGLGLNVFHPMGNVMGGMNYLNGLIRKQRRRGRGLRQAIRHGLAGYNGGGSPPQSSYTKYADPILKLAESWGARF